MVIALVRWVCDTQLITFQLVGLLVKKKTKKTFISNHQFSQNLEKNEIIKVLVDNFASVSASLM